MADLDIVAQVVDKTGPGLKRVGSNIDKTASRASRLGKVAKVAAVAVAGIAVAGVGIGIKLVGDFLSANDAIGKMSTALGIGTETLQRWTFAAGQSGAEQKDLRDGLGNLQKAIGEAGDGTATYTDALAGLGLSYDDLANLSPEEQFKLVRSSLSEVDDQAKQTQLGNLLLGGSYKKLAPLVKLTEAEFNKLAETAPNVVSDETIRASEELNDTIDRLKQGFQALLTRGLSLVIPVIQRFIGWLQRVAVPAFRREVEPAIRELGAEVQSLRGVFQVAFRVVRAVVEVVVGLILLRIRTVIGVFSGLIKFLRGVFTGNWRLAWDGIKQILNSVWQEVGRILVDGLNLIIGAVNVLIREFNGLGGALRPGFTKLGEIGEIAHSTLGLVERATKSARDSAIDYTASVNAASFGIEELVTVTEAVAVATDTATAATGRATEALNTQTKAQEALNKARAFIVGGVTSALAGGVGAAQAAFHAADDPDRLAALEREVGRAQRSLDRGNTPGAQDRLDAAQTALDNYNRRRSNALTAYGQAEGNLDTFVAQHNRRVRGEVNVNVNIGNNFEGTDELRRMTKRTVSEALRERQLIG